MKPLLILLAALISFPTLAQLDPNTINFFQSAGDSRSQYNGLMPKSSGTKGSPFIFEDMPKGDIIMTNGRAYQGIFINIFPEKSEIYVRSEDSEDAKVIILDSKKVEKIIYDETERTFVPLIIDQNFHIAEVLEEDDKGRFIAVHEKKFNKANVGGAYNSGPKYDTYQHVIRYFIINESGETEIKNGKTGLKTLGRDEWKNLQDFVKSNNLDMGNPADMRKIYLHSLSL